MEENRKKIDESYVEIFSNYSYDELIYFTEGINKILMSDKITKDTFKSSLIFIKIFRKCNASFDTFKDSINLMIYPLSIVLAEKLKESSDKYLLDIDEIYETYLDLFKDELDRLFPENKDDTDKYIDTIHKVYRNKISGEDFLWVYFNLKEKYNDEIKFIFSVIHLDIISYCPEQFYYRENTCKSDVIRVINRLIMSSKR